MPILSTYFFQRRNIRKSMTLAKVYFVHSYTLPGEGKSVENKYSLKKIVWAKKVEKKWGGGGGEGAGKRWGEGY